MHLLLAASTSDASAQPLLTLFCSSVGLSFATSSFVSYAKGRSNEGLYSRARSTQLEVADVPVDVPEMRDTRQRYVHTIAGGPRDAQPLGALRKDRWSFGALRY